MLFFDWKKIHRQSGNSSKRIVSILDVIVRKNDNRTIARNKYDPMWRYGSMDFSGTSYLIHPHPLLQYRYKWKDKEIADYIGLASFRNFAEYKVTGESTLDLVLCPLGQDAINKNRLLRIEKDKIHFLYEDYT